MRLSTTLTAVAAVVGCSYAQNIPTAVKILTPLDGGKVGVRGEGWMVDIAVGFAPKSATSAAASKPTTSAAPATGGAGSGGGGGYGGYRRRDLNDDGIFPFLNSPNLTTFKPGPDPASPSFVVLLNTSSDPTQNLAGVFQFTAITNSDPQGNILEAFYTWYISKPGFGSNVFCEITAFFLDGAAPAKYTGDPKTDPHVISQVATSTFFINGDNATTTRGPATQETPLAITVFSPSQGDFSGVDGAGFLLDLVVVNNDPVANYFSPTNGVEAFYHDNFTDAAGFHPGANPAFPGLVVLSNTSTLAGGNTTNLARLFQMIAITDVSNDTVTGVWATWLAGQAFAGKGQGSSFTVYYVNGTAPNNITETPNNIISNVVTVDYTLTSDKFAPATNGSDGGSAGGKTSGAASTTIGQLGALVLAALAFIL